MRVQQIPAEITVHFTTSFLVVDENNVAMNESLVNVGIKKKNFMSTETPNIAIIFFDGSSSDKKKRIGDVRIRAYDSSSRSCTSRTKGTRQSPVKTSRPLWGRIPLVLDVFLSSCSISSLYVCACVRECPLVRWMLLHGILRGKTKQTSWIHHGLSGWTAYTLYIYSTLEIFLMLRRRTYIRMFDILSLPSSFFIPRHLGHEIPLHCILNFQWY